MPSPFPGMDPYLEGSFWMEVHYQLTAEIARQLAPKILPRYLALTTRRFVVAGDDDGIGIEASDVFPDVAVAEPAPGRPSGRADEIAAAPLRMATAMPRRIPIASVEIRDVKQRLLVTSIEVLSPTNKRGEGRGGYLRKRRKILLSSAHLLEIDFLRRGKRVPMKKPLPDAPYFVILSRAGSRPMAEVWPIALAQPLPTVPVPLLPGDADVPVDLQAALTTIYDTLGYRVAVDYRKPPDVPLSPEDTAWAEERLRAAGLRP